MTNQRLRSALLTAGLEIEDLADQLGVDPKTVERWLGGRTPHPRHRAKIAHVLNREQHDLWPETTIAAERPADDRHELTGIYAVSQDIRAPDWRTLMHQATDRIDLLDYTLGGIIDSPGVTDLLAQKARAGCNVRILIAHPKTVWVISLAQQLSQDQPDGDSNTPLDRQINLARGHLEPLIGTPRIELRSFWAERQHTILRFDAQMLVTLHLWGTSGNQAPLLYLERHGDDGLFDQFAGHLEAIHDQASEPIEANPQLYPPPAEHPGRYQEVDPEQRPEQVRGTTPADPPASASTSDPA